MRPYRWVNSTRSTVERFVNHVLQVIHAQEITLARKRKWQNLLIPTNPSFL